MIQELSTITVNQIENQISYIDLINSVDENNIQTIEAKAVTQSFSVQPLSNKNLQQEVAIFLKELIKDNDTFNVNHQDEKIKPALAVKIMIASNFVAAQSRIKPAETIVINTTTSELFSHKSLLTLLTSPAKYQIVINDFIEDNVIYVLNKTDKNHAGLKCFTYIDANQNQHYQIMPIGINPERHGIKINIK